MYKITGYNDDCLTDMSIKLVQLQILIISIHLKENCLKYVNNFTSTKHKVYHILRSFKNVMNFGPPRTCRSQMRVGVSRMKEKRTKSNKRASGLHQFSNIVMIFIYDKLKLKHTSSQKIFFFSFHAN